MRHPWSVPLLPTPTATAPRAIEADVRGDATLTAIQRNRNASRFFAGIGDDLVSQAATLADGGRFRRCAEVLKVPEPSSLAATAAATGRLARTRRPRVGSRRDEPVTATVHNFRALASRVSEPL